MYGLRIGYGDINNNDIVNTKYTKTPRRCETMTTAAAKRCDQCQRYWIHGGGTFLCTKNKYLMPLQPPHATHKHTRQIVYVSARFLHRSQQTGHNTWKV